MNIPKRILLEELAERSDLKQIDILGHAFDKQRSLIEDKAKLKAIFCTRRAAKSFTDGLYLIDEAKNYALCNCLYLGLTRNAAKGIIWKDVLKDINRKLDLNMRFHETDLTATYPNGSIIYVAGADASEEEMNKLLGRKYRLVIIDEASMWSIDMRQMVYGVLKPAMADMRGTIVLSGTSSNITRGLFYDITTGREPGWSLHQWTAFDNPHVATQWAEELDEIRKLRPLFMETALFKQWYLNQWVIDEDAKVYKFDPLRNKIATLPGVVEPFRFVLGADLAHSPDSSAFVIGAYHPEMPVLYIVRAFKKQKTDVKDVADVVDELDLIYNFEVKVIDGQNKMAVAELNNRYGCGFIPADKLGKEDFINIMNAEFIQQKIMMVGDQPDIEDEYESLVWVTDNGKVIIPRKEHPTIHNDCADAALYMWRHCYQYLFKIPRAGPALGSQAQWEPEHIARLAAQIKKEQNPNEFDLEFDKDLFNLDDDSFGGI